MAFSVPDALSTLPDFQNLAIATSRTLWMGELEPWMDENFISSLFAGIGSPVTVKVIRDKNTNLPVGYGFVDFVSHEVADTVLHAYNNLPVPNTEHVFKLNWAQYGMGPKTQQAAPEVHMSNVPIGYDNSLFVNDLDPAVTDNQLFETFSLKIPGVISAKVVTDPVTFRSKGYGFIKFATGRDCQRALVEMQGAYCGTRLMRLSPAIAKRQTEMVNTYMQPGADSTPEAYSENFVDSTGCTLFVQDLSTVYLNEDALKGYFTQFGEVAQVKILASHKSAFVKFVARSFSDKAIGYLNDQLTRGESPVLKWLRVGPTFNLSQQLSKTVGSTGPHAVHAAVIRQDLFMRKLDVVNLNLEYVALHCDQMLDLVPHDLLLL